MPHRLMDGLAGAIDGLVQFLFVDTLILFQDILNFAVRKLNDLLSPEPGSLLASAFKLLGIGPIEFKEFTFGDDVSKATSSFINRTVGSGKLDDEGNLLPTLDERVPAGTQSGAQVNVASQVTSNTEKVTNHQQKPTRDKMATQAGDNVP